LRSAILWSKTLNHGIKMGLNFLFEIHFDLIHLGELGKGPPTVHAEIIRARYPVCIHRGFFFFCIFPAVSFDLDNQMQGVLLAMSIVDKHDEVRKVLACF